MNKQAKAFVIDIAPYRSAAVPPTDENTHYVYGWSDQVLKYISMSIDGFGNLVDNVRKIGL